jgi:hypothetical protein
MWCVIGALAALQQRQSTGKGCVIDTSLFESAVAWVANPLNTYRHTGKPPQRTHGASSLLVPYQGAAVGDVSNHARRSVDGAGLRAGNTDLAGGCDSDRVLRRRGQRDANGNRTGNRRAGHRILHILWVGFSPPQLAPSEDWGARTAPCLEAVG